MAEITDIWLLIEGCCIDNDKYDKLLTLLACPQPDLLASSQPAVLGCFGFFVLACFQLDLWGRGLLGCLQLVHAVLSKMG